MKPHPREAHSGPQAKGRSRVGVICQVLTFWVDGVDTAIPMPEPGRTDKTLY